MVSRMGHIGGKREKGYAFSFDVLALRARSGRAGYEQHNRFIYLTDLVLCQYVDFESNLNDKKVAHLLKFARLDGQSSRGLIVEPFEHVIDLEWGLFPPFLLSS